MHCLLVAASHRKSSGGRELTMNITTRGSHWRGCYALPAPVQLHVRFLHPLPTYKYFPLSGTSKGTYPCTVGDWWRSTLVLATISWAIWTKSSITSNFDAK